MPCRSQPVSLFYREQANQGRIHEEKLLPIDALIPVVANTPEARSTQEKAYWRATPQFRTVSPASAIPVESKNGPMENCLHVDSKLRRPSIKPSEPTRSFAACLFQPENAQVGWKDPTKKKRFWTLPKPFAAKLFQSLSDFLLGFLQPRNHCGLPGAGALVDRIHRDHHHVHHDRHHAKIRLGHRH